MTCWEKNANPKSIVAKSFQEFAWPECLKFIWLRQDSDSALLQTLRNPSGLHSDFAFAGSRDNEKNKKTGGFDSMRDPRRVRASSPLRVPCWLLGRNRHFGLWILIIEQVSQFQQ